MAQRAHYSSVKQGAREKALCRGIHTLGDAELLAILLGTGNSSLGVLPMADRLIRHFDGLRGLFRASPATLMRCNGLGPAKTLRVLAVMELARRSFAERLQRGEALESPQDTSRYLQSVLMDQPHERFLAVFLDTRHRVIASEDLFQGTIDGASVYPRVVAEKALRHGAAAIIVAHNHPSGVSEPSLADQAITRRLKEALALLDIRLLDHFVIGDGEPVSMASRGMM